MVPSKGFDPERSKFEKEFYTEIHEALKLPNVDLLLAFDSLKVVN